MSLLNQMLKDLEQRNAPPEGSVSLAGEVRSVPDMAAPFPLLRVVLALLALLLAGVAVWWWTAMAPKPAVPAPAVVAPHATASTSAPVVAVPPAIGAAAPESLPVPPTATAATPRLHGLDTELNAVPQIDHPSQMPAKKVETASTAMAVEASKPATEEKPRDRRVKLTAETEIKSVTPQQKSDNHYKQAVSLLQQGRVAEARDALVQSLDEDPSNHNARQTLAGLLVDSKQTTDAIAVLQDGVRIAPEQSGFTMALARLQVEAGDRAAGLQTLEQGSKYAGDDAEYHAFYAALLQRNNRHDEAIAQYLTALRGDPANTSWLIGVGISLQEQQKFTDAREAFERARTIGDLTPELAAFVDQRLRQLKGK